MKRTTLPRASSECSQRFLILPSAFFLGNLGRGVKAGATAEETTANARASLELLEKALAAV